MRRGSTDARVLALISASPGLTLADLLGRTPKCVEAEAVSRLEQGGWVVRDRQGRYTASDNPPLAGGGPDNGHGREAIRLPQNGVATGKKRLGEWMQEG
jgi:hypothetical protein